VALVLGKLGVIGFGGPAAHLALMREEMVVRRGWLSEQEFLDLVGAASVLPGPTSTQVGILLGRRRAGWPGLVLGGVCFIAPAMLIVGVLAWAYVRWGTTVAGTGLLYGIKPVVIAIIVRALVGLVRTAVKGRALLLAGAVGALCAYLAGVDSLVILAAACVVITVATNARGPVASVVALLPLRAVSTTVPTIRHHPNLGAVFGEFVKLGCVVFGSGYVLLAFLHRDLVGPHGWITSRQLLDAVSVGQFTPGPVFTTATFIGYLTAGFAGAAVATGAIFLPSFVMMAPLEPVVPRLRAWAWTAAALDGINVAALGLMAGVTIDLARTGIPDLLAGAIALLALAVLVRFRTNSVILLSAGGLVGLLHALA
jgi:chromate transporter